MVNNVSFTGVPCFVRLIDVNKYISSGSLSAGYEHGVADRDEHKTVKAQTPNVQLFIKI